MRYVIGWLIAAAIATLGWIYVLVRRDDRRRDLFEDAMWDRGIEVFSRRVDRDLIEPGSALDYVPSAPPDPASCSGQPRKPLAFRGATTITKS
jgi:hypothetical protein